MGTTISIADMAEMFCDLSSQHKSHVVFDIAEDAGKLGYNPVVKLQLDSSKCVSLGWKPNVSFPEMYNRLIEGMK